MTAQQNPLAQLTEMGVSIWLDDISRDRLSTGNLAALVRDAYVRGVTSNPTIFAKALSSGSAYAEQVARSRRARRHGRRGVARAHHLRHPVGL